VNSYRSLHNVQGHKVNRVTPDRVRDRFRADEMHVVNLPRT